MPNASLNRRMNIALINTYRVVNSKGGTEKVFCDMANDLVERGHNVLAICHDKENGWPAFPLSKRVTFINTYRNKKPLWLTKPLINLRSIRPRKENHRARKCELTVQRFEKTISQALQGRSFDCIVSFQAETTCAIKRFERNIPIITMLHGNPEFYLKSCPVFSDALKESDVIQFLRPEYENAINRIAPNVKAVCIPNSVPQYGETADMSSHTIINVARFDPNQKRQDLLVNAFALVKDKFKDWTLELWGESFLNPDFAKKVRQIVSLNEMENQVKFCGTTNQVSEELKRASIFAFPSKYEGVPLALTEAMSMGLPAVGWKGCPASKTYDNVP